MCSISTGQSAEFFFRLLKEAGVTALGDTRLNRDYPRAFWSHERDIGYICSLHGVEYLVLEDLMPTKEMRQTHQEAFDKKPSDDGYSEAGLHATWTTYLESMVTLLAGRSFLTKDGPVKSLLYGKHEAIALACNCQHHHDCHRSVVTGVICTYVAGVSLQQLYPGERPPARAKGHVLLRDIPKAGITMRDANPTPRRRS